MSRRAPLVAGAAVLLGGLTLAALPALATDQTTATTEITVLAINDFHGRIATDPDTVGFFGTIEELRTQYGPESTLLGASGDNVGASLFASAIEDDDPTIDILRAIGLDAASVGNHEFDQGYEDLVNRIQPRGEWPYLGANVYHADTFDPALPEYALFEVEGLRVAVIGAVTQETAALVSPGGIQDVEFGDPVDAVNRVAAQLSNGDPADGEADAIIASYHEGAPVGEDQGGTLESNLQASPVFRKIVEETAPEVDAILTGHTHQAYAWSAPLPGVPGVMRPVIQTGSYATHVGVVHLQFDAAGRLTATAAELVGPTATPDATLIAQYPSVAAIAGIVDDALANAAEVGGRQVGTIAAPITTAFSGGAYGPDGYQGGERDDRGAESTLGTLVADALLEALADSSRGGAVFAAVNPGGLRADLTAEQVTYADANSVLPFGNNLWTTTLTGAQVKTLLEQQWQRDSNGDVPSRAYLALGLSSNVSYTYDESRAEGDRITAVFIGGEPVDPAGEYRLGTWAFLTTGGDNFHVGAQGSDAKDSGLIDRDAWVAYFGAHSDTNGGIAPSFAKPGASVTGVPDSTVPGGSLTLQVSDLDLTSLGSPANTTLAASWVGSTAFQAPAAVAVTDGAATITVTVPGDAAAASVLELTAQPSGTIVRVPISVTGGAAVAASTDITAHFGLQEWIVLGAIGLTGGIIVLVVAATIAALVARPKD